MTRTQQLEQAFSHFDVYNYRDPNTEDWNGKSFPKELLYSIRMSDRLEKFAPGSPDHVKLAVRCQHIGRWEIARNTYPMDRKGYLQWRNALKFHHARIAGQILQTCGYDEATIEKVKFLLLKKELNRNAETQLTEDVICLVFVEFYLADFAAKHEDDKVIDILKKTLMKMSKRAIEDVSHIKLSPKVAQLISIAVA
ncbi:MAG TPA: DUF4202 domain-containing protein [Chryseolinea sp.]|nr:DUF4202 domain-containing protein [Chryseolinea sp.]